MFALSGEKKPDNPTRKAIQALDGFEKTEYTSSFDDSDVERSPCAFESSAIFNEGGLGD